jgi:hypothetical protein
LHRDCYTPSSPNEQQAEVAPAGRWINPTNWHAAGQLTFHGAHAALRATKAVAAYLAPLKRTRWFIYAKRPFAEPKAVLAYLSR